MGTNVQIDRNNNFDLIRLYAAVNVVISHSVEHLRLPGRVIWDWGLVAAPGVPIFFIISGFLITDSFLRTPKLDSFVINRALRIYPLLAINIVVLELALLLTGSMHPQSIFKFAIFLVGYILSASDMLAGKIAGGSPRGPVNFDGFLPYYPSGVLWTLSVEISFYVVIALLLFVTLRARWGLGLLITSIGASLGFALFGDVSADWKIEFFVIPYMWMFGIGVLYRIYWSKIKFLFEARFLLWIAGYIVITYLCYKEFGLFIGLDYKHLTPLIFARMIILSGVIFSSSFSAPKLAHILLRGNDFSYGIYLWHMFVVTILAGLGIVGGWWIWPVVLTMTMILALASWFGVERPILRWRRRRDS
jgi:peptidoglycan/LPS O-acetylase OafA/YrhL